MAITYNAGSNLITLDDDAGVDGHDWAHAFDMEDVLAADVAGGWGVVTKQAADAYDISARLYFQNGVYFVSESEYVELKPNPINPNYAISSHAGSHLRFGDYNTTHKYSEKGSFWRFYTASCTGSNTNRMYGEVLVYGSNFWGDATNYQDGIHFDGKTRLYNSVFRIKSYLWDVDTDLQDMKWQGGSGTYTTLYARAYNFSFKGITSFNSRYGIFFSATTNGPVDVYAVTFLNCTYSVYISTGCAHLTRIINCPTFSNVNSISAGRPGFKLCYTYNLTVVNPGGTPISGATVELKDVDGTTVFSENTDANGNLVADKIIVTYWYRNAAQGGNKAYNNHTLKITYGKRETEYELEITKMTKAGNIVVLPPRCRRVYAT